VLLNRLVERLADRFKWLRQTVTGTPTLLMHDGEVLDANMRRDAITQDDLLQAVREHQLDDLDDVKQAVLEVDGTISVIPYEGDGHRTRRRVRGRKPSG
jgi:uncharacterized membrane protein YcaP (DUF421 family)